MGHRSIARHNPLAMGFGVIMFFAVFVAWATHHATPYEQYRDAMLTQNSR